MCNVGMGIYERGIERGIVRGRCESIRTLMQNLKFTATQAMDALSIPEEEREHYLKAIQP